MQGNDAAAVLMTDQQNGHGGSAGHTQPLLLPTKYAPHQQRRHAAQAGRNAPSHRSNAATLPSAEATHTEAQHTPIMAERDRMVVPTQFLTGYSTSSTCTLRCSTAAGSTTRPHSQAVGTESLITRRRQQTHHTYTELGEPSTRP